MVPQRWKSQPICAPPSPAIVAPSWLTLGASHTSELAYLFGTDDSFRLRGATDDQVALADIMSRAWTTFARSGSPGHEDLNWVDYGDSAGAFFNSSSYCLHFLPKYLCIYLT